jgi:hypothetical protein
VLKKSVVTLVGVQGPMLGFTACAVSMGNQAA